MALSRRLEHTVFFQVPLNEQVRGSIPLPGSTFARINRILGLTPALSVSDAHVWSRPWRRMRESPERAMWASNVFEIAAPVPFATTPGP